MKRSLAARWVSAWACAIIGLAFAVPASAQESGAGRSLVARDASLDVFVAWAREHAAPLPPCSAQSTLQGSNAIREVIGNARVVALGEPAHGAHEPLAFRNCLFRYLVEQAGFTAIAIESGLHESRRLHDYVAGGPGDARQLAREGLSWGFGRFAENVALLEWMRAYNADPRHPRKIRFYGIDMSGGDSSGLWLNARVTLQDSLAYLAHAAPAQSQPARNAIEPFLYHFMQPGYVALSPSERTRLQSAIDDLIDFFTRKSRALIKASTQADYDWARRNAALARQLLALFGVSPPQAAGEGLAPDMYRADAVRDAAMADNLRWVLEREGPQGRILLFAHNGHILNAPTRGGIWSVYAQAPATMGQHLRKALGRDLLILPTSSASNGHDLPLGAEDSGSLDTALAKAGSDHFLLDIRAKAAKPSPPWLARTQTLRANFNTELEIQPATALDAVIFFNRLTPAAKISAKP